LALIAMVVVLSKVWPRRRCALAVNRVERLAAYVRCSTDRENDGTALQKCFSYRESRYACNLPGGKCRQRARAAASSVLTAASSGEPSISKLITSDGRSMAATIVAPWYDRAAPLQVLITGSTLEAGSRI
jgi:hypothetical protein